MNASAFDSHGKGVLLSESDDEPALALLRALAEENGQSLPRLAKRLRLAASELQRLCVALGEDPRFDGLGLVEYRADARGRARLWLSPRGQRLIRGDAPERSVDANGDAADAKDLAATARLSDRRRDGVRAVRKLRMGDDSVVASASASAETTCDRANRLADPLADSWADPLADPLPERSDERWAGDWAIDETPVALLYNGMSFAVMMATAVDLEDFALGFALSERIVESADEFRLVDTVRHTQGIALHAAIPQARFDALEARRRTLEGRSGCGLCGVSELEAALRPAKRVGIGPCVRRDRIRHALEHLTDAQPMNARSGGAHAAAFFAEAYRVVREDVGRHNAVDKVVGALRRDSASPPADRGFLVVTSRASYEIVQKAANAGFCIVVAMSAPTALAIAQADATGITLVAFARAGGMNVYTVPERIL